MKTAKEICPLGEMIINRATIEQIKPEAAKWGIEQALQIHMETPPSEHYEATQAMIDKATPSQLCEALLRATNKWIEE